MSPSDVAHGSEACDHDINLRELVRVEQIDMALRLAPLLICLDTMCLIMLGFLTWMPKHNVYLATVGVLELLSAAGALYYCWRWRAGARPERVPPSLLAALCAGAAILGVLMGIFPIPLYIDGDLEQRQLIASSCVGMIGTVMAIAVMPPLAMSFLLPIIACPFFSLSVTGGVFSIYASSMLVLYGVFIACLIFSSARS